MNFTQFAQAHGLIIRDVVYGKWVRVPTVDHPKKRNGAYKAMGDVGFVQNHATMQEVAVWRPERFDEIRIPAKSAAEIEASKRAERERQIRAIKSMRAYWDGLKPLREWHPYLDRKQLSFLGCHDLRVDGDTMVIPLYRGPALMSLQTITMEGEKRYRAGCPIKGNSYILQRRGSVLTALVEGFATGLAIYQSMPMASVVVCFDAGNMVAVSKELKVRGLCVVCADNDWRSAEKFSRNTGIEKGQEAADAIGCGMAFPKGIEGSDWADALIEWGDAGPGKIRHEVMKGARPVF
ncbi:toprim domain-containing protein [Robbsia andropogonis]|uniref:toprim domain-containing protein n=1 Tax=Robbsia andropogonis TaxID=28092 RepID=UPI003D24221A